MPVVEEFVSAYGARDWVRLAGCFSPTRFIRVGPYADVIDTKEEYLAFLRRVVPTLSGGYELQSRLVAYAGHTAVAELVEHLEVGGEMTDVPEAIVFRLDDEGLIEEMHLYLQQPGGEAPVGGKAAMGRTGG